MGQPAETMSKLSRRSLISGAAVAALAALPPLEALAALPGGVSQHASKESLGELAEVRRLIAALVRIEDRISAAENANDAHRAEKLEGKHRRVYRKLRKLQTALESRPPRCGVDLVTRAELVGYEYLHGKPRADWNQLRAVLDESEYCDYDRAKVGLALAVLWLADHSASEQPGVRAA